MRFKYVILTNEFELVQCVLFSTVFSHSNFREVREGFSTYTTVSAGECSLNIEPLSDGTKKITAQCYGESTTLGLQSRGILDATVIERLADFY